MDADLVESIGTEREITNNQQHIMKIRRYILAAAAALAGVVAAQAQELKTEVFDVLDLDAPGLEQVKALHLQGQDAQAAEALLTYYRARKDVHTPEISDPKKVKITKEEQQWADDGLQHTFFVHKGYQPSYNYGEDINWRYWPVQDNELRWQLHRHKWWIPMGKAYQLSGDEKYAEEWTRQYIDWIRKNPNFTMTAKEKETATDQQLDDLQNTRYAWRPLEVSTRIQDQTNMFMLFLESPHFTPEFLTEFLVNYHRHADYILNNYSEGGNHLLFEAQRMIYAGTFFKELKDAKTWRDSGIDVLNKQIKIQVYEDGGQFELCPNYHLASIGIFLKALAVADMNGFRSAFPQSYTDTIEKMIEFYANICYPDYSNPCFSDAKLRAKSEMIKNYKQWSKIFPDNAFIKYLATQGKEGQLPEYKSKGYLKTGFFVFRNSWANDAVQMVVKAGPPAFWHNQPDNGTFELWYNGSKLFADSGSYVYQGSKEVNELRNWFRATNSHNTLTLRGEDLEKTDSKTLLWQPEGDVQILVTENQSYKNLKHRRSIFFVDGSYFVIVDEAIGKAQGPVSLYYQMPKGKVENSREDMHFATQFDKESNMKLQVFSPDGLSMKKEEGWLSEAYRQRVKRMKVSFTIRKETVEPVRYITVIVPKKEAGNNPAIRAKFMGGFNDNGVKVQVKVGKEKKILEYKLD